MALSQQATRTAVPARFQAGRAGAASRHVEGSAVEGIQLRAGGTKGEIVGYGSVWNVLDLNQNIVRPGAFTASLLKRKPVMLWSHDTAEVIGKWVEAREDAHGLRVRGKLNLQTERGREAFELLKSGDVSGLSIGAYFAKGGVSFEGDNRVLTKLDLIEISVVAIPANEESHVESVQAEAVRSARDFERFLRSSGFSRAAARKLASGGWRYLQPNSLSRDEPDDALPGVRELIAHVQRATQELRSL